MGFPVCVHSPEACGNGSRPHTLSISGRGVSSRPESGRLGGGGSPETAGRAQAAAPAQFELTASQAPPAWLGARQWSPEGEQEDGGRAHSARGSGTELERDLQGAAPNR